MKTKRIRSGAPWLLCGVAVLLFAMIVGFHSIFSYVAAALLAFLLYTPLHRYFPDRFRAVEAAPNTGNIACDQLILEARGVLKNLHDTRRRIPKDGLDAKVERIEQLSQQMLTVLERQPELQGQLRTFLRYYLPTTLKLTDARAQMAQSAAMSPEAQGTLERIGTALDTVCQAFEKQLTALDQFRYLNIETEMDVLRDLLNADGLLQDAPQISQMEK